MGREKEDLKLKGKSVWHPLKKCSRSRYDLVKVLGAGAFGSVYLAKDRDTGEEVAIKAGHSGAKASIIDEIRLYNWTSACGRFQKCGDWFRYKDGALMVTDLLGSDLHNLYVTKTNSNGFGLETILLITLQIVEQLQVLHENGLIHRDIKPQNIMFAREPNYAKAYLIDFGLIKSYRLNMTVVERRTPINKSCRGTPEYASLAAMKGLEQIPKDDLESLLYGMLSVSKTIDNNKLMDYHGKQSVFSAKKTCLPMPYFKAFGEYIKQVKKTSIRAFPDYERLKQILSDGAMALARKRGSSKPKLEFIDDTDSGGV